MTMLPTNFLCHLKQTNKKKDKKNTTSLKLPWKVH